MKRSPQTLTVLVLGIDPGMLPDAGCAIAKPTAAGIPDDEAPDAEEGPAPPGGNQGRFRASAEAQGAGPPVGGGLRQDPDVLSSGASGLSAGPHQLHGQRGQDLGGQRGQVPGRRGQEIRPGHAALLLEGAQGAGPAEHQRPGPLSPRFHEGDQGRFGIAQVRGQDHLRPLREDDRRAAPRDGEGRDLPAPQGRREPGHQRVLFRQGRDDVRLSPEGRERQYRHHQLRPVLPGGRPGEPGQLRPVARKIQRRGQRLQARGRQPASPDHL